MPNRPLIDHVPRPLLDDLVQGRLLPIVGAGMSLNADLPHGEKRLPDWKGLAREISRELPAEFRGDTPIEALSAYEHRHGRNKLVQRVMRALRVNEAQPGRVHKSFCQVPFESVVTTNVEQLLELAYRARHGDVLAITEEEQLRLPNPYEAPLLLKLHGDLHHPSGLVLTEKDYDEFAIRRPIFITWLANQLISKTGLLIGYSLEDADFRQVLATIRSRLGESSPDLYVLEVNADAARVARYERRGVRVINLPRSPAGYGVLADLFDELYEYWTSEMSKHLLGTTASVRGLLRAGVQSDAAVLFLVPDDAVSLYDDYVFPALLDVGLRPVTRQEVAQPNGYRVAVTEALLRVAGRVVVQADQPDDPLILKALAAAGRDNVLVVGRSDMSLFEEFLAPLPESADDWVSLGQIIQGWAESHLDYNEWRHANSNAQRPASGQPADLAAVVLIALIELEGILSQELGDQVAESGKGRGKASRYAGLRQLLDVARTALSLPLPQEDLDMLVNVRNELVHGGVVDDPSVLSRSLEWTQRIRASLRPLGLG